MIARRVLLTWARRCWHGETAGVTLINEANAYLSGQSIGRVSSLTNGALPAWLWLNAVIHGSRHTVLRVAFAQDGVERFPSSPWQGARVRLARELLKVSDGDPVTMLQLQRSVLTQFENRLHGLDQPPAGLIEIAINELRLSRR